MSDAYDVVVLGAGHNGLVAAAYLAQAGRKVAVLERRPVLGGLAAGEEFHPGFRSSGLLHDTGLVRRWVVEELALESCGLELVEEETPLWVSGTAGPDDGFLLWRDAERARSELERHSPNDAHAYAEFRAYLERVAPVVRRLLDHAPPDAVSPRPRDLVHLGAAGLALRRLGKAQMLDLLRIAPMCVADWLGEWFESPLLRAALAAPAVHGSFTGPWSPGTNANLLHYEAARGAFVSGGPQALVEALERAAVGFGVEVRTEAEVVGLCLDGERVTGVALASGERIASRQVAAACDPRTVFLDLFPRGALPARLEHDVVHIRARGTTAKVHLAVRGDVAPAVGAAGSPQRWRLGASVDDLERAFDAVKYRQMSAQPILEVEVPTLRSPELAPEGHHVLSVLVHFVPYDLEGGWTDAARERLREAVVTTLEAQTPGLRERIVGSEVLAPADLEARYRIPGGHIFHGEHALDQLLARPVPTCARYETPFAGLFLCGSGSHPGGGITCAPGALAAKTMLRRGTGSRGE